MYATCHWLVGLLARWLVHSSVSKFIGSVVDWVVHLFVRWLFFCWFVDLFVDCVCGWVVHSLVCSLVSPLVCWMGRCFGYGLVG